MLPEVNLIIPFVALSLTSLVLVSNFKRLFLAVALGLLLMSVAADALFGWQIFMAIGRYLVVSPQKLIITLVTMGAMLLMTSYKRLSDYVTIALLLLPLVAVITFVNDGFIFFLAALSATSLSYYLIVDSEKRELVKKIARSAYIEVFLIVAVTITYLLSNSDLISDSALMLSSVLCVVFSYLYVLAQASIIIGLSSAGLKAKKLLALNIPKTVMAFQAILMGHSVYEKMNPVDQKFLADFLFTSASFALLSLSFITLFSKTAEKYSKIYVTSQFIILANVMALNNLPSQEYLLHLFILDIVISYASIQLFKEDKSSQWLFVLQSMLIPVSIVFLAKLMLIKTLILEMDYHPLAYIALLNQVCLSVSAARICSGYRIGKFNLPFRHAVYLSCVIISACLMVILP